MAVRAVIFDFGGVLYRTPDIRWMKKVQNLLGLQHDPLINSLISSPNESPFVMDIMLGNIPETHVWEIATQRWKIQPALLHTIRRSLMSPRRLNHELAELLACLRGKYRTAILSNAGSDARRTFTEIFKLHHAAEVMVISAEEGLAKPDLRIYERTVERLGVPAEECVFVDDFIENVEAARAFGMKAVHFQTNAQALAELAKYIGLPCP